MTDTSFHTPQEIRRHLGLPVIGHIPVLEADAAATARRDAGEENVPDPFLCTHYSSSSTRSEAFRGVRTALYFNTRGAGHQVIQVTSPNASDGKSTTTANLAISIAQSGKRIVLVDCDFRKPRVHKIFGLPHEAGLASVIQGQCELEAAIQPSGIENLSILPCGPRPKNPAELLTSPRFVEALKTLREAYDYVLVDTPPVLVVTDPSVVAPRVDGVVLVLRMARNIRPAAERAREVFASLGVNVIGVVVNGIGDRKAGYGYGYGPYYYGSKYQYKYSYAYSYGYGEAYGNQGYYADDPDEHAGATNGHANGSAKPRTRKSSKAGKSAKRSLWGRLFRG
jgi:capsular exopolysaccharide synthesis family protein